MKPELSNTTCHAPLLRPVVLTCDLADGEVVSSFSLRVPGGALDAVGGPCFQAIKGHRCVGGVQLLAGTGALTDDAERVEDGVLHRGPGHEDGAIVRRRGVQHGRHYHYRQVRADGTRTKLDD